MTVTMKKAVVVDRGQRPQTRGWFHAVASLFALVSGAILATFAWLMLAWWQALGVTIYVLGTIALFGVSASYHLGRWRSINTVNRWRRADHATIAVFIAATYTPLCLVALPPSTAAWVLIVAWTGAVLGVVLALVWVDHPRWLAVSVYLVLGWLVIPVIPNLWANAGPAIVWLLAAGGVVYSLGAVVYALRWPGRSARIYGYHEHFHTATIVAAIAHHVAIWLLVT